MKILVIDDEPLVRKSLSRACAGKGHQVIEASDGIEGLAKWTKEKPDLVFLDVLMPGLSGPQLLKEIGSQRSGKVILMSAYSGEHNVQTAAQIGADLFIAKPFDDIFGVVAEAERLVSK
jgi:two-component system, response regulator PdtaR